MNPIGSRIKQLRKEKSISQSELAEKIGVTKQNMYKYENGIITNIPSDKIELIATHLGCSPTYLMGWEESKTITNLLPLPKTKKVPLMGTIACGTPILAVENVEEYIDMDAEIHADFALRCKGDSMINARIFHGDIVYIRQQPTVENGEIAAVLIGSTETEATLKRVYQDAEKLRLCAENPQYQDMVFFQEEMNEIRILGKAVAFLSTVK